MSAKAGKIHIQKAHIGWWAYLPNSPHSTIQPTPAEAYKQCSAAISRACEAMRNAYGPPAAIQYIPLDPPERKWWRIFG